MHGPWQSFYVGETSRSVGERFKEHVEKYEARSDCKDEHDGDLQKLDVGIACKRSSDAMLRQISEAVLIEKDDPDLNKRCEWGNRNVPWRKKEKGITS